MKRILRPFQRFLLRQLQQLQRWVDSWLPQPLQQSSRSLGRQIALTATRFWSVVPKLKPFVRVPKLQIYNPLSKEKVSTLPLIRDSLLCGRHPHLSEFVIPNDYVSDRHFLLQKRSGGTYKITDQNSSHGLYHRGKRISQLILQHRTKVSLGDPRLANVVSLTFYNPPPLGVQALWYGGLSTLSMMGLLLLILLSPLVPDVRQLPELNLKPTVVLASDRTELYNPLFFTNQFNHQSAKHLGEIPEIVRNAVLASEDSRFFWHWGVDPVGIARAILLKRSGTEQGASTLTQQVARSLFPFVGTDYNLARKAREAMVSLKLELFHSKNSILLAYLNNIYLGVDVYGFLDAAPVYFDKPLNKLNLQEAATLTAMLLSGAENS